MIAKAGEHARPYTRTSAAAAAAAALHDCATLTATRPAACSVAHSCRQPVCVSCLSSMLSDVPHVGKKYPHTYRRHPCVSVLYILVTHLSILTTWEPVPAALLYLFLVHFGGLVHFGVQLGQGVLVGLGFHLIDTLLLAAPLHSTRLAVGHGIARDLAELLAALTGPLVHHFPRMLEAVQARVWFGVVWTAGPLSGSAPLATGGAQVVILEADLTGFGLVDELLLDGVDGFEGVSGHLAGCLDHVLGLLHLLLRERKHPLLAGHAMRC
mmetsp:Transcript_51145/g.128415  ORF Transcript_51145/g.128415 Transcript_51145/m.128415 type:complete len:268 (+) Transcript_51145:95-898(+)